jgi:hypothetical protein
MQDLTKDGKSKIMGKWLQFAKTKGSNNEELLQEKHRIKVVDVKLKNEIIDMEEMMRSK